MGKFKSWIPARTDLKANIDVAKGNGISLT